MAILLSNNIEVKEIYWVIKMMFQETCKLEKYL